MTIPQAHLGSPSSGSSSIQHSHSPTRRPVNDGPPPPAFDLIASSGSTSRSSGNRNSAVDGYNTLAPGFEDTNMPDYTNSRKGIETSSPVSPEDGNHFPCSTARAINMAEMQRAIASVPSLSRSKTEHGIAEDIPRMIHQELANGAQLDNCDIQKANVHSKKPSVQIGLDSNFHKQLRDIIEEVTVQRPLDADLESPSSKDILMVTPRSRSGSEPLGELGNFQ